AKVVKFNSQDTILADVYGKLVDQEVFATIKRQATEILLPGDEKITLRLIEEAYRKEIKVKTVNGKNKFAYEDYKNGAYVFDEIVPLYPNSLRGFVAKEEESYRIFYQDKDFGYNKVKPTYHGVDLDAVSRKFVPVQNKKGQWGAVFLSGERKELKQAISPKYDRFENFDFENRYSSVYALFVGQTIKWIKTDVWNKRETKKKAYKFIEAQTKYSDHIRWLKKSKRLRAKTVETLFQHFGVDRKKEVLHYQKSGPVHLLDLGDEQQMLWHDDYLGESFAVPKSIVSIELTQQVRRVEGIQEYLDLHLAITDKDGQRKNAKAIYLKEKKGYKVHRFEE
ncbi:MAG: hypothetical protein AAF985_21510, partial [Bacteroidota bacterium]